MTENELEIKHREALVFQKAQHIVALLEGLEDKDIETAFKLAREIRQYENQRSIAILSYRQKQTSSYYSA